MIIDLIVCIITKLIQLRSFYDRRIYAIFLIYACHDAVIRACVISKIIRIDIIAHGSEKQIRPDVNILIHINININSDILHISLIMNKVKTTGLNIKSYLLFFIMISISLLIYIIPLFTDGLFNISDSVYSIIYISISLLITMVFISQKEQLTSPMFLFNCTCFLFLGGRFFSHFILGDLWDIFELNFLTKFNSNNIETLNIFLIVIVFQIFSNLGYFLTKVSYNPHAKIYPRSKLASRLIYIALFTSFFLVIYNQYSLLAETMSDGYLSRYSEKQSTAYSGGDTLIVSIFYVLIGISFSIMNRKIQMICCILVLIYGVMNVLGGQRGPFVVSLLFCLWFYGLNKKISLKKILIFCFVCLFAVTAISSITARGDRYADLDLLKYIGVFLYHQGITLSVINYGINQIGDAYPIYPYITSFLPGGGRIASMIAGKSLMPYELGFGAFTANFANPQEYLNGRGTGWSIVGNLYFFSGCNLFIYSMISYAFGAIIKYLNTKSRMSMFYFGLLACIIPALFFVARAEFKTVFTTAIIYCVFYLVYIVFDKLIMYRKFVSSDK